MSFIKVTKFKKEPDFGLQPLFGLSGKSYVCRKINEYESPKLFYANFGILSTSKGLP